MSDAKRRAFYERFVGTERNVLWEKGAGWTDNYIRVGAPTDAPPVEGSITGVHLGPLNVKGDMLTIRKT